MAEDKYFQAVRDTIREYVNDKNAAVGLDSVLHADLGIDSLERVEIVCALEDRYGIEIDEDKFKKFKTVRDIVTYLEKSLG